MSAAGQPIDLAPARWIWLPSGRTLANTFVLFRREVNLGELPIRATGYVTADSRYCLRVNGERAAWGPAPCDPRALDVDPVDLLPLLRPGRNVLAAEVLFYGVGDGTWPGGKPGFLCRFELEYAGGRVEQICSDAGWLALLDRAHRPGQYKRWFLRALQEEFDARLHPDGWALPSFVPDERWVAALELRGGADRPAACTSYPDYLGADRTDPALGQLRVREIPALREERVPALQLADAGTVAWRRDPLDWFEYRIPDAFTIQRVPIARPLPAGGWELPATADPRAAVFATLVFPEQLVGWPTITVDAPAGTVVELITQESHDPDGPAWLDSHMFSWSRLICREGLNHFGAFDYESLRWLQLHVRGATRPVWIEAVGVLRRSFPWPNAAALRCADPAIQRVLDAGLNTLRNSAQETCVDGMGRERQQYSGDGGHQLHALRYAFGETQLPRRFLRTFSQGQTADGYFLDSWPAFDRLMRIMQRQLDASDWGPLLDHGVGFVFDCWHHVLETGDLAVLDEPYPRLVRFADYLLGLRHADGLLPVEGLGVPAVWIDHEAYRAQRHKQCAFNLYAAAMLGAALAPIAEARGDHRLAERYAAAGAALVAATQARFWDAARRVFVINRPWLAEEGGPRLCDRSLATALLFDQCPVQDAATALAALADCPPELGLSYPANAGWRYWALARHGRVDVVLRDLRERWATMASVRDNNTLQEFWQARPDTADQWSHCAVAPIYVMFMDIAGIRPTEPGFRACRIRPQLGDLRSLDVTAHTVLGPLRVTAEQTDRELRLRLDVPAGCAAELVLPAADQIALPAVGEDHHLATRSYRLRAGINRCVVRRGHRDEGAEP